MIVDVHGHWGPWFFTSLEGAADNLAVMDRYGIDLAIVSATEAVCYDAPAGNRALADALPTMDRLYGYVTVNPHRLADGERDLRELLPTGRFVGAKVHTDYTGSPIASPQTRDALAMLSELDCPVLVHTWGETVLDLAQACADLPRLRAIAGHLGAGGWRYAIEAARPCPRLYLEPSWSYAPAGRIAEVVAAVDDRQLLFGTTRRSSTRLRRWARCSPPASPGSPPNGSSGAMPPRCSACPCSLVPDRIGVRLQLSCWASPTMMPSGPRT